MNIIFDLDGTLSDSGPGIMRCAEETLRHCGLTVPDRATLRTMVGPPLRTSFLRFGIPQEQLDEAVAWYRMLYNESGKYENTPYPGIPALLERLRADGHRVFVATSKPEYLTLDILNHFGMIHLFDMICGALQDGIRDKKEQVIAWLLDQAGIAGKTVMVGDTVYDVIGAAFHSIPTVAVCWGYGDSDEMLRAGALAAANSSEELYRILCSLT